MRNYKSYLRKRPHYEEVSHEMVVNPPKIKYPDRTATFLRNSHYLSRFDGDPSFLDLEEQENNIIKEQLLQQELRRLSRNSTRTHAGLQSMARSSTVPALVPSDEDMTADAGDEIESLQSARELEQRVKRFNTSEKQKQNLQGLAEATTSDMEPYLSPRENPSSWQDAESTKNILRRYREKAPEVVSAIANVGSAVGSAALSTAGTLAWVGKKAADKIILDDLKVAGGLALDVGSAVGSGAMSVASTIGSGALNVAKIGTGNFIHNLKVTGYEIADAHNYIIHKIATQLGESPIPSITQLLDSQKPTFAMVMNAIHEGRKAYRCASKQLSSSPEGQQQMLALGSSTSSSASSSQPSMQQTHGTGLESYNTVDEWLKHARTRAKLYDQLTKRPDYANLLGIVDASGYNKAGDSEILKTKLLKMNMAELAKLILHLDGKPVK